MGTDVHGVWQHKQGRRWEVIESEWKQNRHYQLFAVLADVRNGYGFAGIATGEPVKPISPPRGLPTDFTVDEDFYTPTNKWLGDHSHTWLTSTEMLEWRKNAPSVVHVGILSREQYRDWDGITPPPSYCGGISGPAVAVINDNAVERETVYNWTHIRCSWTEALQTELAYFFDEVQRLHDKYGEVRLVMGFDS